MQKAEAQIALIKFLLLAYLKHPVRHDSKAY